ncbi:hypothetical protein K0T92_03215 [Paenibacillus oenotherae]|uniref:Uncharacterized protein n=1 Tax=Paenibacillus oenotherae TaxID=1435645 RepID=A0ABS7D3K0_9BACL|nr:hypothetical protein [Paenibacillus oenotherae]
MANESLQFIANHQRLIRRPVL